MNILQKHQIAAGKANIYYHKFLTRYKKNEKRIYIFCEGNEDFGYYVQAISKPYPDLLLGKIFVEGKDNVLALQRFINWDSFSKNQLLFFVDRDMSYWLGENNQYDENIYVTDQYSFENDAVTEDFFISCLEDLYGFASATQEELQSIREFYTEKWKVFVDNSKYIMAAVAISFKVTQQHLAKKIEKNKIIKIETDNVWKNEISGKPIIDYIDEKLEIQESDKQAIDLLIRRFDDEKDFYSVRGKWAITFFVKALEYIMDNSREYVPSLYDGKVKAPKRLCEITPDKAMAILAPRMRIAKTLQEFCDVHISKYLKEYS
jgi:hypothetical protein